MTDLIPVKTLIGKSGPAIIFIHGLNSHPYDTWRSQPKQNVNDDETFWPRWLAEDFPDAEVWLVHYEAPTFGIGADAMPLEPRAKNVLRAVLATPALQSKRITFVCYSLGGLIAKQLMLYLKEEEDRDPAAADLLARIETIIFIATPHTGSDKAALLERFSILFSPSAITRSLKANGPALLRINTSYRGLARERQDRLSHRVYIETLPTIVGTIVGPDQSDPGLDADPLSLHANHITITQPRRRNSDLYRDLVHFLGGIPAVVAGQTAPVTLHKLEDIPRRGFAFSVQDLFYVARLSAVLAILVLAVFGMRSFFVDRHRQDELDEIMTTAGGKASGAVRTKELTESGYSQEEAENITEIAKKIENAPERSNSIFGGMDIRACGGDFRFTVVNNRLECANGEKIPFLELSSHGEELKSLEALVFHFSASQGIATTFRAMDSMNVSTHLLVSTSGAILQTLPFDKRASHAGKSSWPERGLTGLNSYSIGIEFINMGNLRKREDGTFAGYNDKPIPASRVFVSHEGGSTTYWDKYTTEQIEVTKGLTSAFQAIKPNIGLLGHDEITVDPKTGLSRKFDPGPAFPWQEIGRNPIQ